MSSSELEALKSSARTSDDKNHNNEAKGEKTEEEAFEHVDRMTQIIGEFGPWQLIWTSVLCVPIALHGWQMMANKFLTFRLASFLLKISYSFNILN